MTEITEIKRNVLEETAIELACKGYHLFPVRLGTKKPIIDNWPQNASRDEHQIREWLRQFGDCNWGILTEGLLVIDIDRKNGKNGFDYEDELKAAAGEETWEVAPKVHTPNGGQHVYFRLLEGSSAPYELHSRLDIWPGVDVKAGSGAYVLAPGSEVDGRVYAGIGQHQRQADKPMPKIPMRVCL